MDPWAGWLAAGWLAGWLLAGWLAGGWLAWLVGWLAGWHNANNNIISPGRGWLVQLRGWHNANNNEIASELRRDKHVCNDTQMEELSCFGIDTAV